MYYIVKMLYDRAIYYSDVDVNQAEMFKLYLMNELDVEENEAENISEILNDYITNNYYKF